MAQSIADIMGQIRGGAALHDAGKKLQELVAAVRATGKAGEISFTIKVAPDKTDDRVVTMKPVIKSKIPEKGWSDGIFFIGVDGKLSKEDPAQLELLKEREESGVRQLAANDANLSQVGRGAS